MKTALRSVAVLSVIAGVAVATLLFVVALNLRTFARLTFEQPVATVQFEEQGPQRYLAVLTRRPSGVEQTFALAGDEWQVDARVLTWSGWANVLGLDARYRLERISGRYRDVEQEKTAPRSVYSLHQEPAIDLWSFARAHPDWIPFVNGYYGSATYLPMAAGARYEIHMSQSGLVARPDNEPAKAATRAWR